MEPNQQTNIQPSGQTPEPNKSEKDEKYAEALAKMATLDYDLEHKNDVKQKHFLPKKTIVYIVISLILSVITWAYFAITNQEPIPDIDSTKTTDELLETTKELRDFENQ
ncbi:hypothetical protein KC950_00245 [Candidatus Saccharibacteria bacterium]|nr:hypothetical protein [Candidatus Saccharibacteria bacterium]